MPIKSLMLRFDRFHHATERAYLIQIGSTEHWVPKKLAWNITINKKLGGHITVPGWLYEKLTGEKLEDVSMSDATLIIEKHIPDRKEPIKTEVDATLIK